MSWQEGEAREVEAGALRRVVAEIEAEVSEPVVVVVQAQGAELHVVAGAGEGTVLLYHPHGRQETWVPCFHSVGDPQAADADPVGDPPLVAYYFGSYTEFPRWMVIAVSVGWRALEEFCAEPTRLPAAIDWKAD